MDSIDEQIRRAMEAGEFDNLPGKGKPLNLSSDPNENPEWRMANHVLRNSGFTLPWIEMRQEIEKELAEARGSLSRTWAWWCAAAGRADLAAVHDEWERAVGAFSQRIAVLNQRIIRFNLQAPHTQFHYPRLDADREIGAVTSGALDEDFDKPL